MASSFSFAKIASSLEKALKTGNADNQDVDQFLSTGFAPLDFAISGRYVGGGLPVRRMVEISGPESAGKTAIATQAMIAAQRMGGAAGFHDHERSFKLSLATRMGLDTTPGAWTYRKPRTFEESIDDFVLACKTIRDAGLPMENPICWVWDSIPNMIPAEKLAKGAAGIKMNDKLALANCTSQMLPIVTQALDDFNVCGIFINQLRLKPGVIYGNPETTPGGNAPKYQASVRIQLGATRVMQGEGDAKEMIGSDITARCIKNKINRPYLKAKWRFTFRPDGSGFFDGLGSLFDYCVDKGLVQKEGKYLMWEGLKLYRNNIVARLTLDPEASKAMLIKMLMDAGVEPDVDDTIEADGDDTEVGVTVGE